MQGMGDEGHRALVVFSFVNSYYGCWKEGRCVDLLGFYGERATITRGTKGHQNSFITATGKICIEIILKRILDICKIEHINTETIDYQLIPSEGVFVCVTGQLKCLESLCAFQQTCYLKMAPGTENLDTPTYYIANDLMRLEVSADQINIWEELKGEIAEIKEVPPATQPTPVVATPTQPQSAATLAKVLQHDPRDYDPAIYIGNLPSTATVDKIKSLFAPFSQKVPMKSVNLKAGFAFLDFSSAEAAIRFYESLPLSKRPKVDGQEITISLKSKAKIHPSEGRQPERGRGGRGRTDRGGRTNK